MREILFRGKRINGGGWAEGSYIYAHKWGFDGSDGHLINNIYATVRTQVDPETVGQFTGLVDRNGNRIFEGDIIEGHCHSQWSHRLQRCVVCYDRDAFVARHYVNCGSEQRYYTYKVLFSKDVTVIGNIHDNPELLERSNENGE